VIAYPFAAVSEKLPDISSDSELSELQREPAEQAAPSQARCATSNWP